MTGTSFSLEELEALLSAEQAEFTAHEQSKFERVKAPVKKVPCYRSVEGKDGWLFVVANDGTTAVVFDDVEQEFGICKSAALDSGTVREWGLAGSLVFALMHLK